MCLRQRAPRISIKISTIFKCWIFFSKPSISNMILRRKENRLSGSRKIEWDVFRAHSSVQHFNITTHFNNDYQLKTIQRLNHHFVINWHFFAVSVRNRTYVLKKTVKRTNMNIVFFFALILWQFNNQEVFLVKNSQFMHK